jgi:hypothetical protein
MKKLNQLPVYIAVRLENTDTNRALWLDLPATKARFAAALAAIGSERGNFRVADYRAYGTGLTRPEAMETPLAVMNYLAYRLQKLTPDEMLILRAITDSDRCFDRAGRIIDFTFRTAGYTLLRGVTDEEKLGRHCLGDPNAAAPCCKPRRALCRYEYGKKLAESEDGVFTPLGYLTSNIGWNPKNETRPVPDSLNLRGYLNEDLYGDWENWDAGA